MNTVYGLVDPRTGMLRYVGVTLQDLRRRLKHHFSGGDKHGTAPRCRWIRKLRSLGLKPHVVIIEANCAREREIYWIAHYRASRVPLLNRTDGGDGCNLDPEALARRNAAIGDAHRGKTVSEEAKAKLRAANLGKKASPETRAKMAVSCKGWHHTPEAKEKIRISKLGKPRDAETLAKMSAALKGKKKAARTPEYCAAISARQLGKKLPPERVAKAVAAKRAKALERKRTTEPPTPQDAVLP